MRISPQYKRADADGIAERFGQQVDWAERRSEEKTLEGSSAVTYSRLRKLDEELGRWVADSLRLLAHPLPVNDAVLALSCDGGFLSSIDGHSPFSSTFDPHMNVLMGDRGSGKSTLLNLIGLLSPSVEAEGTLLVEKLRLMGAPSTLERSVFERRARKLLQEYDVARFACLFQRATVLYTLVVLTDRVSWRYEVQSFEEEQLKPCSSPDVLLNFPMNVLTQGEIIRIADSGDRFYLSKLVDSISQTLYHRRTELADSARKLGLRYDYLMPDKKPRRFGPVMNELEAIRAQNVRFRPSPYSTTISLIQSALTAANHLSSWLPHSTTLAPPAFQEPLFNQLTLQSNEQIRSTVLFPLRDHLRNLQSYLADALDIQEPAQLPPDKTITPSLVSTETSKTHNEREAQPLDIDELHRKGIRKLTDPRRTRIENSLEIVHELIAERIGNIQQICAAFSSLTHSLDDALRSLLDSTVSFLRQKRALLVEQEARYGALAELASKDGPPIRLHTTEFDQEIAALDAEVEVYEALPSIWTGIFSLRMTDETSGDLYRLKELVDEYLRGVSLLHNRIWPLNSAVKARKISEESLYSTSSLEMRQGSVWRDLRTLSFGQKTGTVLKLVLSAEGDSVVLLDQPEDHLDNYSISKIIAPAIREIAVARQVITVTHSANLLLSIPAAAIIVLSNRGDAGYIRARGALTDRILIEEVIDVLEGGVDTFYERLERYQSCIRSTLVGQVVGGTAGTIEAFFRRQTIEELRNDIQLFIGDRNTLSQVASAFSPDYIKHEIPVHSIRDRVFEAQQDLASATHDGRSEMTVSLSEKLRAVLAQLELDIHHLERTLNDISAFDGAAKPTCFDLGTLIQEVHAPLLASRHSATGSFEIDVDRRLFECEIYADRYHVALVFRNLLRNAHKAIQLKMIQELTTSGVCSFIKSIRVFPAEQSGNNQTTIIYCDNGGGIDPSVRDRLYRARCTTHQDPTNHGLGAQIIRGLLELNGGAIDVVSTGVTGTCQRIVLPNKIHST